MEKLISSLRLTAIITLITFFPTVSPALNDPIYFNAAGGCVEPIIIKKHVKKHFVKHKKHHAKKIKRHHVIIYREDPCRPCKSGYHCVKDYSYKRGKNAASVEICIFDPFVN